MSRCGTAGDALDMAEAVPGGVRRAPCAEWPASGGCGAVKDDALAAGPPHIGGACERTAAPAAGSGPMRCSGRSGGGASVPVLTGGASRRALGPDVTAGPWCGTPLEAMRLSDADMAGGVARCPRCEVRRPDEGSGVRLWRDAAGCTRRTRHLAVPRAQVHSASAMRASVHAKLSCRGTTSLGSPAEHARQHVCQ
jgi:hypothetical protein